MFSANRFIYFIATNNNFFSELVNMTDISCVFVDEAQFLSKKQVHELGRIADDLNIPAVSYTHLTLPTILLV